jgi:radical SAM superfamily enzyme YgiQ (UPF0313 family)
MTHRLRPLDVGHVVLVNAATDSDEAAAMYACFPPLGLTSLATVLRSEIPGIAVQILDQAVTDLETIVRSFRPGCVVGISSLATTHRNALKIAHAAANKGCFVVMGNDHASRFARTIVETRPVDAVIVGDHAERPLAMLVQWLAARGQPLPSIPGLVIRTREGIREQPDRRYPMSSLPVPDRTLIDHDAYRENFRERFGGVLGAEHRTPTTMNLCRGCAKVKDRCAFCDIYDLSLDRVPLDRAWHEIGYLASLGLDYLWEVGDSFTSQGPWLRALARSAPRDLDVELFVYARAAELVRPGMVETLRELGVTRVNVGMESGDEGSLRQFNKGNPDGARTNLQAARLLREHGILLHASLILGAPGETEASLGRTVDLVESLLDLGVLTSVDPSVLYPLPGAPVWRLVESATGFVDARGTDVLPADLRQRFARAFTKVTWERLEETASRIRNLVEARGLVPGGFG